MDQIKSILDSIKSILLEKGFEEVVLTNPYRKETNYVRGNVYCIPQYVKALGFLIEYAESYEEAITHGHVDGEVFPLELGASKILAGLKKEIERNM